MDCNAVSPVIHLEHTHTHIHVCDTHTHVSKHTSWCLSDVLFLCIIIQVLLENFDHLDPIMPVASKSNVVRPGCKHGAFVGVSGSGYGKVQNV